MSLFLRIAMCIAFVWLFMGYLLFRYACRRGRELDWADSEAVARSNYKPFAEVIPLCAKWIREHGAQDISCRSHDDLILHGWWIPVENARATIILFHGYKSTYLVDFAAVMELYHGQGYNLLIADQRSHGRSEGKYITFGVKECRDAASWVEFHNRSYGPIPVFLCGLSMGASTVLFAAGNPLAHNVRGITADCGFTSPADILTHVMGQRMGGLSRVMLPAVNFWARQLALFDLRECSTERALKNCPVPILMCHGLADNYVPSIMSQRGYDACGGEKELILVEGAGHGTSYLHDRERVTNALLNFIEKHLKEEHP